MKKKKVQFGDLKPGDKFRYERKLYLKDDDNYPIRISDGYMAASEIHNGAFVAPVKIKIRVKG